MEKLGLKETPFRVDIQALRGFAVLIVVLYHAGLNIVPAGFLGVDIFFVVSGFLITGIVRRRVEGGSFSFAHFYTRRVLRLLPAAYVMLLATAVIGFFVLTSTQYHQFRDQLIGSVFFAANFVLWSQTGYFSMDAAFKPLLHMWSLAIEEQYYLVLPIMLAITPGKWWKPLIAVVTLASLALCLVLVYDRPSITFFFLPTRAWELGIGSLATFLVGSAQIKRIATRLLFVALPLLVLVPLTPLPGPNPGFNALLVCLATAVVILADTRRGDGNIIIRALAGVGDISYSLYLVHWPLFSLTRVAYLSGALPTMVSLAIVILAFVLAAILYRCVEQPLRRSPLRGWRLVGIVLLASTVLVATAVALERAKPSRAQSMALLTPVGGLSLPGCFSEDVTQFNGTCSQSPTPEILVWGDSYSGHITPGLLATTTRPIVQASKGHCGPFANYAAVVTANERAFSEGCLRFNRSVLDYLAKTPSIKVVVLAGAYFRSFDGVSVGAISSVDGRVQTAPTGIARTIEAQRETTAAIRALGKRVVLMSPPPPSEVDLGQCWERTSQDLLFLGPFKGCTLDQRRTAPRQADLDTLMKGFETRADTPVIRLNPALCANGKCQTIIEGRPIFRDGEHLSNEGSVVVAKRLRLGKAIWVSAR